MIPSDVQLNMLGSFSCEDLVRLGLVKPKAQGLFLSALDLVKNFEYDINARLLQENE